MKPSEELKKQLEEKRTHRTRTMQWLDEAQSTLSLAQDAFNSGRLEVGEMVQAQAAQMALSSALHRIELELATAQSELDSALAMAARAAAVERLAGCAGSADESLQRHRAALSSFYEQVEAAATEVLSSREAHLENRRVFEQELTSIVPDAQVLVLPIPLDPERQEAAREARKHADTSLAQVRDELKGLGADTTAIAVTLQIGHGIVGFDRATVPVEMPQSVFHDVLEMALKRVELNRNQSTLAA